VSREICQEIVEESDASTLVQPGWTAAVDEHGNLALQPSPR
jgi:N-methylhydantoinase A/oxoprolinase/acetone carboxylase beta subunit